MTTSSADFPFSLGSFTSRIGSTGMPEPSSSTVTEFPAWRTTSTDLQRPASISSTELSTAS